MDFTYLIDLIAIDGDVIRWRLMLLGDGRWDFFGRLWIREAADELVAGQETFLDLFGFLQKIVVYLLGDNRVFPGDEQN